MGDVLLLNLPGKVFGIICSFPICCPKMHRDQNLLLPLYAFSALLDSCWYSKSSLWNIHFLFF